MRVTDEMADRGCDALLSLYKSGGDWRDHPHHAARAAITAAVADVPEPLKAWERAALGQHGQDKDRIASLEASLAEWQHIADEHMEAKNEATARITELEARLEEERGIFTVRLTESMHTAHNYRTGAEQRIARLEAKLAKIREIAVTRLPSDIEFDLIEIIDAEPTCR